LVLEDFEDGLLNTPGVTVSALLGQRMKKQRKPPAD
jgi:hypothetical protein